MESLESLEKLLKSFERYYTIKKEDVANPFTAEAEFRSHGEQYVLLKIAKIADIDSNDYVYFKTTESLSGEELKSLVQAAWTTGLEKVKPYSGHRNSDVTLIILAEKIDASVQKLIKKTKLSKSYKWSFWGWSNFRLAAMELSSGGIYTNRLGSDLKKILANIK